MASLPKSLISHPRALSLAMLLSCSTLLSSCKSVSFRQTGVIGMIPGGAHTCVTLVDNGMRCWGLNLFGQLGNNSTTSSPSPVQPIAWGSGPGDGPYPGGGKLILGVAAGAGHTCAIDLNSGAVYCWGDNARGQLGTSGIGNSALVAQPVSRTSFPEAGNRADVVVAGYEHTCALFNPGLPNRGATVGCWGRHYGPLPQKINGLSNPVQLSSSGNQVCALEGNGTVKCWRPPLVITPSPVSGLQAKKVAAGSRHACAINSADQVQCWGSNSAGQLGTGRGSYGLVTVLQNGAPLQATNLTAGDDHTCALQASGAVVCWGNSLGTGTTSNPFLPSIAVAAGADAVAAGANHTCSRYRDGTTYRMKCWGSNDSGQLGRLGTGPFSLTPVEVEGLP